MEVVEEWKKSEASSDDLIFEITDLLFPRLIDSFKDSQCAKETFLDGMHIFIFSNR
jgi:hypothetical protein